MSEVWVEPAGPNDLTAALEMLFRQMPPPDRPAVVARTQQMVERRELDPGGLLIARRGAQVVGAMLSAVSAGAAGLVWPPQVEQGPDLQQMEDALLSGTRRWLGSQGVKMAQVLLRREEMAAASALERNGFRHITQLQFLHREIAGSQPKPSNAESLTWELYSPQSRQRFEATLLQTYAGTQDCPELNGLRTIEEIIAGHQAQGSYDPRRWWLALEAGTPVGVLLLNDVPEWQAWEIVYMGVIASARGRGIGGQLVHKALREAGVGRAKQLTLSMDARNALANRLYRRFGFQLWDVRDVFIALLEPHP